MLTRFKYNSNMEPFNDHEHSAFVDNYVSILDPRAKHNGKNKSTKINDQLTGTGFWKHIADRLPGRTIQDVIQHYYDTKHTKDRGGYREALPKTAKTKPGLACKFEELTLNLTTDTLRRTAWTTTSSARTTSCCA